MDCSFKSFNNDLVLHSVHEKSENLLIVMTWQYPFSPYRAGKHITHSYDFTQAFSHWLTCVMTMFNRNLVWQKPSRILKCISNLQFFFNRRKRLLKLFSWVFSLNCLVKCLSSALNPSSSYRTLILLLKLNFPTFEIGVSCPVDHTNLSFSLSLYFSSF